VTDALRAIIRDVHLRDYGHPAPGAPPLALNLTVSIEPARNWEVRFVPSLAEQVQAQLDETHTVAGVYRDGAVYCYKCSSSVCEHATPPTPLSVFGGYDPMGKPEWLELAQLLLRRSDRRVSDLFDDPPRIVCVLMTGHELRQRQLPEFGRSSRSYAILGQLAAGYFATTSTRASSQRFALTLQIVESHPRPGLVRVHLNTLARLPDPERPIEEWLASDSGMAIARARTVARAAVERLNRLLDDLPCDAPPARRRQILGRLPAILRQCAESIERASRRSHRRTRHAEQRRVEQRRPVPKALEDLQNAPTDAFYLDEKAGTYIVRGESGRTHVFNAEGRLVTSFVLTPAQFESRVRTGRWSPIERERADEFRRRVLHTPSTHSAELANLSAANERTPKAD
jgi:hypothetical protein